MQETAERITEAMKAITKASAAPNVAWETQRKLLRAFTQLADARREVLGKPEVRV